MPTARNILAHSLSAGEADNTASSRRLNLTAYPLRQKSDARLCSRVLAVHFPIRLRGRLNSFVTDGIAGNE
jgi:hypothetical protein